MSQRNITWHRATIQFSSDRTDKDVNEVHPEDDTVPAITTVGNDGDSELTHPPKNNQVQIQLHNDEMDAYLQSEVSP
jgi:hypothetical protein